LIYKDAIKKLSIADPETGLLVKNGLKAKKKSFLTGDDTERLVEKTIWGLSVETSFGKAIAQGWVDLAAVAESEKIRQYCKIVGDAGEKGPTIGKIMATHLVPILIHGDKGLLGNFMKTIGIILQKGEYILPPTLETLSSIIGPKKNQTANAYLDLLHAAFSLDLSYNQCRHFAQLLSKSVISFSPLKRTFQIRQAEKIIKTDILLVEPFLYGMEKGLYLLLEDALENFVSQGLIKFGGKSRLGKSFLSLDSKLGIDYFHDLQQTIPFSQVQKQLNRYLHARTGRSISVQPISNLPKGIYKTENKKPLVISNGKYIYLPDEIGIFPEKKENLKLYKTLTRLESGHYELNTYNFDIEKVFDNCRMAYPITGEDKNISDMERFFSLFTLPELASDLFTIFEHGRIRIYFKKYYPGIIRSVYPLLEKEAENILREEKTSETLLSLYMRIAIGITHTRTKENKSKYYDKLTNIFRKKTKKHNYVETRAELVLETYNEIEDLIKKETDFSKDGDQYLPLKTPFGRRLHPEPVFQTFREYDHRAENIKAGIEKKGFKIYKSDIRQLLREQNGNVSPDDIKKIILDTRRKYNPNNIEQKDILKGLSDLDMTSIPDIKDTMVTPENTVEGLDFRYREWDCNIEDYLQDHTRVVERKITGSKNDYYSSVLENHKGLVRRIRYSFELLKPEDLAILRRWRDGDEFDYRALLDFALDKKAGITPSDRLYIKRLKKNRDVSVILLVDLSRSTSNIVSGSETKTILDVEKEAIVLLCEALQVVGDSFLIAGFSGNGRMGVDYFIIKEFTENMNDEVKQRISGMAPQRRTRMGAAIRHSTNRMEKSSSKVRLMILLGDGFPNDTGYKNDYAIEDTRRAISEARSKNIFVHGITVNLTGGSKLDDLYGNIHHNLISDVRDLPDKLLKIYGSLTR
jgi:nitric oxide reductase NorD protein